MNFEYVGVVLCETQQMDCKLCGNLYFFGDVSDTLALVVYVDISMFQVRFEYVVVVTIATN